MLPQSPDAAATSKTINTASYLRFVGQKSDVDLRQGLHGFGGSGFCQKSKQGVWNCCRATVITMRTMVPCSGPNVVTQQDPTLLVGLRTRTHSWVQRDQQRGIRKALLTVGEEDVSGSILRIPGVSEVINQTLN